ncbi:hypothetical protein SESBI_27937 [Sesbania bispinosa]|nr:hypothetical protein SESBI_27937 [Sesbania bispinosa]
MKHRHSIDSSDNVATIRSLPETPRMSSARRSDVEHRLSLQINKENMGLGEDLEAPRFSFSKRKYDENNSRSPSHYARQIVKQVKESVSRKVGLDITNTVKNREHEREDFVSQFKFKKPPKKTVDESSTGKHSNSSYSPRLSRFMDTNHKPSTKPSPITPKDQNTRPVLKPSSPPPVVNIEAQLSRVSTKSKPQILSEKELQQNQKSVPNYQKTTNGKLSSRLNKPPQTSIRNKQEEPFIIRPPSTTRANDTKTKSKRTHPLSSNLLSPNLLHVKTDPSPPATKIPQKQVTDHETREAKHSTQLFSCSRQKYKQEVTHTLTTRGTNDEDKSNGAITATTGADDEGPEYQYITTILSRTGVLHNATVPHFQFQWFSSTHPLDPSLFHRLEFYPSSNSFAFSPDNDKDRNFMKKNHLGPRCNRRLLFDLVDEVLSEILVRPRCYRGRLLETVWKRVRSFPRAKCEFLEDIDGLIEMENIQGKMKEEEGERLVAEIEGKIMETLVHETITVMVGGVEGCVRT